MIQETVNNSVRVAADIFDRIQEWKRLEKDAKTRYRLLYLECKRNLDLISSLDLERENNSVEDIKLVISNLSTEIIELVFFESKNTKIIKNLTEASVEYLEENDSISKISKMNPLTSVYLKIKTTQSLAQIKWTGDYIRNTNFKTRLRNIRLGIVGVLNCLESQDEVDLIINTSV